MMDEVKRTPAWLPALLSWMITALVVTQLYLSTKVATTPLWTPERIELRTNHMSIGLTVLILVIARLLLWWRSRPTPRPPNLPASSQGFAKLLVLAIYLTVLGFGLTGPLQAWSEGFRVAFWGLPLPALAPHSYALNVFTGYVHSALGFFIFPIVLLTLLVGIYQSLRYKVRLLRLLPGSWV